MPVLIDAWMQHPTPRFLGHDMFESLRRWAGTEIPTVELPLELTIAAMDQASVQRGLISAWYGPDGPLITNDEVAGFVARHPDRLVGVASVDLRQPVVAVRELRRAVHELGFRARRVIPWLWGLPPNDPRSHPLSPRCVGRGLPACTQGG